MNRLTRLWMALITSAIVALTVVPIVAITGCGHATLEQGGAYAPATTNVDGSVVITQRPDFEFFVVDEAYQLAYDSINTTFEFERNNRAWLWQISPEIKHSLDKIRPAAQTARVKYAVARAAYLQNPVAANLSTLQTVLEEAKAVAAAAIAAVPANAPAKPVAH